MSILLDALRKSEEQRRLGSAPSIHDGSGAQPPGSAPGQQWIPMAIVANGDICSRHGSGGSSIGSLPPR